MGLNKAALERLKSLVGSDEDFAELAESFLEEAPQLAGALALSFALGDMQAVRRAAHSLKSNARDFGADDLAALCARIEHAAQQSASPAPDDVAAVSHLMEIAMRELRTL